MTASSSALRVDIVSDVVCPWCVIGYRQLAAASEQTGIALDIHWHPFELNPNMAQAGENLRAHLAAKYGTTLEGSIKARARLTEMGAALGFTFNYADDMRMWNTFLAHQLIDWAEDQGHGHEAKLALFAAHFTERRNVSDLDVLVDVADQLGLDRVQAKAVLARGDHAPIVREKQTFWTQRGVSGVPAMVFLGRHLVAGAQGADIYADVLRQVTSENAA